MAKYSQAGCALSVFKIGLGRTDSSDLKVTCHDSLEPPLNTVVYLLTMITLNKTSHFPKSAALPSFRQRLSYVLALLFVFVSFNPAQAGMTIGQGMMGAVMGMSDSTVQSAMDLNDASQNGERAGEGSTAHMMNMAMNMTMSLDDCQSDCDCCPGLCSAYLPTHINVSTFLPANFTLADSAIQRKVSANTTLFRPPISH